MPVSWPDEVDRVIAGDLTAAVAYGTPAGGAVVTAVAPIGLRDRERGEVTFTTSLGLGRKLERLRSDPRIALAYHAREHGFAEGNSRYVLVQGRARIVEQPDRAYLDDVVTPAATRFLGAPKRGPFWDRWLAAYYADRVPVDVEVARVTVWPDLACADEPEVIGEPIPGPPESQSRPKKGTGPRVDVARAAKRLAAMPHVLLAFRGSAGNPVIVPIEAATAAEGGLALTTRAPLPEGERRAGLLGHSYKPQLIGLRTRQHTGWLTVTDGHALYAPHTETGFVAPANKTLLLLGNGFVARRGLKRAMKERAAAAQT
jgi:hypothetical protein